MQKAENHEWEEHGKRICPLLSRGVKTVKCLCENCMWYITMPCEGSDEDYETCSIAAMAAKNSNGEVPQI